MASSPAGLESPVRLRAVPGDGQPDATPALEELYRGFEKELLILLWTQIGDLMPMHPQSRTGRTVYRTPRPHRRLPPRPSAGRLNTSI